MLECEILTPSHLHLHLVIGCRNAWNRANSKILNQCIDQHIETGSMGDLQVESLPPIETIIVPFYN